MNCISDNTIVSAKEHLRVEDSLVETLDAQRQVEPMNPFPTDETNALGSNANEEVEGLSRVEEPDEFMENVRAFIRGIDISTL